LHKLQRPVFVIGAPRTGTTTLHKLLSIDPGWQCLHSWLTKTPMTRPPRGTWDGLPEYQAAVAAYDDRLRATPVLRAIHYVLPNEVDECNGLMSQSMKSNAFGSNAQIPSYDSWLQEQDFRPVYRRVADNLRLIGAGDPDRRWLLKNPSHLLELEALLEIFGDAVVIHIHRDPLKSMPSLWNLLLLSRKLRDGAAADPRSVVRREQPLWHAALMRGIDLAARFPDRICEVLEDDLLASPADVAARIYAFAGEMLTPEAERMMKGWLADNPRNKYGEHRYAAEDFGTSAAAIADYFSDYRSHYGFDSDPGKR